MQKEHFFICKDNPFLLLGRDKWLTVQELAGGGHALYSFPNEALAQSAQSLLPKRLKPGTKLRNSRYIEQVYGLKFTQGRGFDLLETADCGPAFEESFRNESLIVYVLPGRDGSRGDAIPDPDLSGDNARLITGYPLRYLALILFAYNPLSRNLGT